MAKIRMTVDLEFDEAIYPYLRDDEDESEVDWFYNHLLGDDIVAHSNLVGAEIGTIKVIKVHEMKYEKHE